MDLAMFCCTTLRDVIFAEWYFANVISTTGILQHAVVCRVTTFFLSLFVFFFLFLTMQRYYYLCKYVTLLLLIFSHELASKLCSTHAHPHGRDACAMLRNTRKPLSIGKVRKRG